MGGSRGGSLGTGGLAEGGRVGGWVPVGGGGGAKVCDALMYVGGGRGVGGKRVWLVGWLGGGLLGG